MFHTEEVDVHKMFDVFGKFVEEFGLNIRNFTIVNDNAANMVAIFRDRCCKLSSFAHYLNLVMVDMLASDNKDLQTWLTNLSYRYDILNTDFQRKLKKTLTQECLTQ